jgi:Domain of unknown function (DUF1848)
VIISASYKTDIPTFYGDWFMRRLRAAFCKMVNPYNKDIYSVSLAREDVDGFVFWTKNAAPFLSALREVQRLGYPFVVQYTINGYPRELETAVIDYTRSVATLKGLSDEFGPKVVVWRYDPILFSSLTPPEHHLRSFEALATALKGSVDEVAVSFAQFYQKTRRNLASAARDAGFTFEDPPIEEKRDVLASLADIARANGMCLTICSQAALLVPGAAEAQCIDARRLEAVGANRIAAPVAGNREDCKCFQSKDIGEYDTCPHGCVYCYSVQNRRLAQDRYRRHDPASEFLFEPPPGAREAQQSAQTTLALPLVRRDD